MLYVRMSPLRMSVAKNGSKVGSEEANRPVTIPIEISATTTCRLRIYEKPDKRSVHGLVALESFGEGCDFNPANMSVVKAYAEPTKKKTPSIFQRWIMSGRRDGPSIAEPLPNID